MNTFVVETMQDLSWLRQNYFPNIKIIFYYLVRPFEPDDFPSSVTSIYIRYCMVEQNFSNLPCNVKEIGFFHNVDSLDRLDLPTTVQSISFSVCVGQKLLDNLPPWLKRLAIYYRSAYNQSFGNLPVGLETLYFEYLRPCKENLLELVPPRTEVSVNQKE
jgi:hypothetical protein